MELQCVILAGGVGTRLSPFTDSIPKCALPVGNQPVLLHTLRALSLSGFEEAIIVAVESKSEAVQLSWSSSNIPPMKIKVVEIPDDSTTIDALKAVSEYITRDFAIISGDLVTDVNFGQLVDTHRAKDATCTVLLKRMSESTSSKAANNVLELVEYTGLAEGNRLVFFSSSGDVEEGIVRVSRSFAKRHTNWILSTNFSDAFCYIFSRDVIDWVMGEKTSWNSIKHDLIPYLVRNQYKKKVSVSPQPSEFQEALEMSSSYDSNETNTFRCYAHIINDEYCTRVNTLQSLMDANMHVVKNATAAEKGAKKKGAAIGPGCVIGQGVEVGTEKTFVKQSVIGNNCKLSNGVRIQNSVLFDNVRLQTNVSISNSIVGNGVEVPSGIVLKHCIVAPGYTFESSDTEKNYVHMHLTADM